MFLFFMTVDPLMLRVLLDAVQNANSKQSISFVTQLCIVCALSISMLTRVTCMEICYFASCRVQNNVRSVLVHAIFRKSLWIPDHLLDIGRISNLMATDADKIGKWSGLLFSLSQWSWTIISLPMLVYFLHGLVGSSAFIGMAMIIVGAATSRWLGLCLQVHTRVVQECRDARATLMSEMVRGIRTVKLQVWEPIWLQRISEARAREMRAVVKVRIIQAFNSLIGSVLSVMVPVTIFAWYAIVIGKELDAATAFTTLGWISTLQWSVQSLPGIYNTVANLTPSLTRIDRFLTASISERTARPGSETEMEMAEMTVTSMSGAGAGGTGSWRQEPWLNTDGSYDAPHDTAGAAVEVQNAAFGYKSPDLVETRILQGVNLQVKAGSFVMIAGPVGSGKSTLLASLAGARPALSGLCRVRGLRAFVPQKPFLLNGSVKENILFGLPCDQERYESALQTAALPEDLKTLSRGDATMVGESGVQLSGGQKARVALARAIYSDADVICLDDVLSAVDAHTARFIWEKCFTQGFLKLKKTVILVSHQIQYLSRPEVNSVVILREGRIWLQGSWGELARSGDAFLNLVEEWEEMEEEDAGEKAESKESKEKPREHQRSVDSQVGLHECQSAVASVLGALEGRRINGSLIQSVRRSLAGEAELEADLVREGTISWTDFRVYLEAFGSSTVICIMLLLMVFSAVSQIASTLWLAAWTSNRDSDQEKNVLVYFFISVSTSLANCAQAILLTVCALAASRTIHQKMLQKILAAPMSFFDASPTGRVLNRFLQDLQNIDSFVPNSISDQIVKTLNIVTQLSLVYIEAPWVLCTLPVLAVPYSMIYKRMRIPNRDSRRLESAARSPVYTHFNDTLHGRETLRAFGAEARFERENLRHIGVMSQGLYGNQAVSKWAQALTTQWGCVLYCASAFVCVELARKGQMPAGHVGLVLLYSAQLQRGMMDYMTMGAADVETKFVSVERVAEYVRLEGETEGASVVENWPKGEVKLEAVAMRYRLHRDLVLRGIDLHIPTKSKLAFCGRTGCGKSSLFSALNRLYPLAAGRVIIDGIDISTLPLRTLRANVRVVSQESFLISGSLRQNLTMGASAARAHPDDVLWHCLRIVGLEDKVRSLPNSLDFAVETAGQNFSVGERQLVTLARVLVPGEPCDFANWTPPKILLCDEATANIDVITDEKVHDVVLGLDATVMMICHRLQHISRFQQVVVLDAGKLVEHGSPDVLLDSSRTTPSHLARLCAAAGL
ncbi:unnamed protein product [Effrenium voratum]|uniref:Uncharacterized protein n=2 Tax=Effrenium voratum TaxID=2562239 RepID=A0AA36J7I6_9DINO|nr:unnamed protein product [Effrenium voratum]